MTATGTIDFEKLELKPDHKYILFVDPARVDIEALSKADPGIDVEMLIFPVYVGPGKSIKDCVFLVDRGGSAEEFIEKFTQGESNGVPE